MPDQAPAGWYPDPERDGHLRYWLGNEWSAHQIRPVQPRPGFTPAVAAPRPRQMSPGAAGTPSWLSFLRSRQQRAIAAGSLVALVGVGIIAVAASRGGGSPRTATAGLSSTTTTATTLPLATPLPAVVQTPTPTSTSVATSSTTSTSTIAPTKATAAQTEVPKGSSSTATTTPPSSSATTTTTSPARRTTPTTRPVPTTTVAPPPTTAPRIRTLLSISGNGETNSPTFTAAGPWSLEWSFDCGNSGPQGFAIYLQGPGSNSGADTAPQEVRAADSGTTPEPDGGTFSLQVASVCSWTVRVTEGP